MARQQRIRPATFRRLPWARCSVAILGFWFGLAHAEPPVLSNLDGDVVNIALGQDSGFLDAGSDATLVDPDSPDFNGGSITATFAGNYTEGLDLLEIVEVGGLTLTGSSLKDGLTVFGVFSWDPTGGVLTIFFDADATASRVQTAIRAIRYRSTNVLADASNRTVTLLMDDGDGFESDVQTVTITFAANCVFISGFEDFDGC